MGILRRLCLVEGLIISPVLGPLAIVTRELWKKTPQSRCPLSTASSSGQLYRQSIAMVGFLGD